MTEVVEEFWNRNAGIYVEDKLTREYLDVFLGPKRKLVGLKIVGGAASVKRCVVEDVDKRITNTFGVIDRDYDRETPCEWRDRIYVWPCHEVENYLLDWHILAQFDPHGRGWEFFRDLTHQVAEKYLYSVAYNQLIADVRRKVTTDFPRQVDLKTSSGKDGKIAYLSEALSSAGEIIKRFSESEWFRKFPKQSADILSEDKLRGHVSIIIETLKAELASPDAWRNSFPGKEMFRAVVNAMFNDASRKIELTRFIAQHQCSNIPADVEVLIKHVISTIS